MFAGLRRLKIKIEVVLVLCILVIVGLLSFGVYAKFRGIQSVDFIEDQSESTTVMTELLRNISESLNGIEIQLCKQGDDPESC
jgi:hypothetical protein